MTAVVLPSTPAIRSARVQLLDWGSNLAPVLGGPVQRVSRPGSRFQLTVEMPPLAEGTDGRIWAAALRQGKTDGVVLEFPQPGFTIGSPGSPLVNGAVAGGTSVPIDGLTAGYVVKRGQFLTFIHAGRRYLHSANADVTASGLGAATVEVTPMLRVALADGDTVEMNPAKIEGYLEGEISTDIMLEPFTGVSFTIVEAQ